MAHLLRCVFTWNGNLSLFKNYKKDKNKIKSLITKTHTSQKKSTKTQTILTQNT